MHAKVELAQLVSEKSLRLTCPGSPRLRASYLRFLIPPQRPCQLCEVIVPREMAAPLMDDCPREFLAELEWPC